MIFEQIATGGCQSYLVDRIGLAMIEAAEREGKLPPGGTVIEATAGNTGLGLALVARAKGYKVLLVVPDKMSAEKVLHLKALGAEVHWTRSDVAKGHPAYYQDMAARLAKEVPNSYYVDQFNNPANPLAHETTTAPEIWQQAGHRVDAIVCGVGSGGTLTGLKRYFQRVNPPTEIVLADPKGSLLADYIATGEDFVPSIADLSGVKHAYTIDDEESFGTARELLKREGIASGSSTGTLLAAALRYCREQTSPKRVVTFVCDTGTRYLSKVYNDHWMFDQGLLHRPQVGDLRDLISRRMEDDDVVNVAPDDQLLTAFQRMRASDVSQVPVLKDGKLVGLLDESDLLMGIHMEAAHFHDPVSKAMSQRVETLPPDAGMDRLLATLNAGLVAVIADKRKFYGLITRFDLLNHLRRTLA
ncbi:MAG: pyridoxal-phosphate dependent enzyme [Betaproteobacteria bacterium]|nr:MAG: pyridoxal-phosphate dependent enzyme [Betaproteobacteria bacterium]